MRSAQGDLDRIQHEVLVLAATKTTITSAIESEKARADEEVTAKRAERDQKVSGFQTEISDYEARTKVAEETCASAQKASDTAEKILADFRADQTKALNDLSLIKEDIKNANTELARITGLIASGNSEEAVLSSKITSLSSQVESISVSLDTKTKELRDVESALAIANSSTESAGADKDRFEAESKTLVAEIDQLKVSRDAAQTSLLALQNEEVSLRANRQKEDDRITARTQALSLLEQNIDAKIEKLKRQGVVDDANALAAEKGLT